MAGDPVVPPPGTTYGTSGTSVPWAPGSAANEWAKGYAQGLAAGERESDARAEAAHAKGYEQGQRDALTAVHGGDTGLGTDWNAAYAHARSVPGVGLHGICYVDPRSGSLVQAVCACGESAHIKSVNAVAARVGTDRPTCACTGTGADVGVPCTAEVEQEGQVCTFCSSFCAAWVGTDGPA